MHARHASTGGSPWPPLDRNCANCTHQSKIDGPLVAGLDGWADGLADIGKTQQARQLLMAARYSDPDLWRNRLREMVLSGDTKELEQLVQSAPVEELRATTLILLGHWVVGKAVVEKA